MSEYEEAYNTQPEIIHRPKGTYSSNQHTKSKREIDRARKRQGKRTLDEGRAKWFELFLEGS